MPKQSRISDEDFIRVWMYAVKNKKRYAYIAQELGVSRNYVGVKANYLRGAGVKLPKLLVGQPKQTDRLNKVIEQYDATTM